MFTKIGITWLRNLDLEDKLIVKVVVTGNIGWFTKINIETGCKVVVIGNMVVY